MAWNIARTLAQDKIWITQDGRCMLIADMDQTHRQNTHAYLLRRAKEIHEHVRWLRVRATVSGLRVGEPNRIETITVLNEIEMDPERWLRATPFMVALDKAIRDHDAVDGEVVDVRYDGELSDVSRRMIG